MNARQLIAASLAVATLGLGQAAQARDDDRRHRHDGPRYEQRHTDRHEVRRVERHVIHHGPRHVQRDVRIVHRHVGHPGHGPRWQRGHYLPREIRTHRHVVVDHRHHPRLYPAPRGHQWVRVDGEFLLVAVATGLIAHAILSQ